MYKREGLRIAYFTDTYYPEINGVTNTLSHLHGYLKQKGIEHLFFTPEYEQEEQEASVKRFRGIQFPFAPNSRIAVTSIQHDVVKRMIEEFQPNLIHVVTELTIGGEGVKIAKEMNIPLVMSYHTNFEQYLAYFHAKFLEKPIRIYLKQFHEHACLNLCPSNQTLHQLEKIGYHNLSIWSRGVDNQLYSPQKRTGKWRRQYGNQKFICLYVGRLSHEKGLDIYLEAIRKLNKKYEEKMVFLFAGDGPYRDVLKKCGIKNVHLTGFVKGEELANLYADADLFVFPSGTETFGNVLLEAMASGLPCICTEEGGVLDFARQQENALMVPFRDSVALADAVVKLYQNPILREKISKGALKTGHMRSWESVMDGLMQSYEEVLHRREVRRA